MIISHLSRKECNIERRPRQLALLQSKRAECQFIPSSPTYLIMNRTRNSQPTSWTIILVFAPSRDNYDDILKLFISALPNKPCKQEKGHRRYKHYSCSLPLSPPQTCGPNSGQDVGVVRQPSPPTPRNIKIHYKIRGKTAFCYRSIDFVSRKPR